MGEAPRSVAEIRAALQAAPAPGASRLKARRGKPGAGAYVAPYDGPMGECDCAGDRYRQGAKLGGKPRGK